ncbi:hypothetical protein KKA95_05090, partial [Patescibacteria group bacterium]|nr:hypothetical protein [Patescibacteria group bacterium]
MSLEGTPTTPVGEKFELNDEYRERVKQSSGRLYDAVAAVCEGKELSMQFEQTPLELAGYKFTFE